MMDVAMNDLVTTFPVANTAQTGTTQQSSGGTSKDWPCDLPPCAPDASPDQSTEGAFCTRSTFFVNGDWPLGTNKETGKHLVGQMYVERLEPLMTVHSVPIVLIHGDWHTGQIWITKPDGMPGWASYFNYQGYRVYVVDLPPCGRSNFLAGDQAYGSSSRPCLLDASLVERDVTAPARQRHEGWKSARLHTQWPGTGRRGDPAFHNYCASLVPLPLTKAERQTLAQNALGELLERTGRAILIGEGSGATMAWLAADIKPHLVAGVVAVEPAGPPCGTACSLGPGGVRRYTTHIRPDASVRQYGLAEIPLTYDPPVGAKDPPLDVMPTALYRGQGTCMLQRTDGDDEHDEEAHQVLFATKTQLGRPRHLVNLKKMRHGIVTGQASSHSTYDWATVEFLRQAGVSVCRIQLERFDIKGNGHLMFLEANSDEIAGLINVWISCNVSMEA